MRDPYGAAPAPKKKKKTTAPSTPPGFRNLGGTFTPGGFVPTKPKVVMPPDQAPYKHGQAPAQKRVSALASGGETTLVDQGPQPQAAHRAAQTMAIQRMLNSKGANLAVDGQWGPRTEAAYQAYLHHAAQYTRAAQTMDATRNPAYQEGPHVMTPHEKFLLQQAEVLRRQPSLKPAQTHFSDVKRYAPSFHGEQPAGWEGGLKNLDGSWVEPGTKPQPGAYVSERPYYTDAATHARTRGEVNAANQEAQFEAMFGAQTVKDIQDTPHLNPAFQSVVEGVGSMLPGVQLAQGHGLKREIINDLLWLGPNEVRAPFKLVKSGVEAARAGADIKTAARGAVALWREQRLARIQNPIIRRDLASSPDRQSFIAALRDVPKLSGTEQHALLQVADHNAVTRAAQTGEKPSVAWGKANFGESTFHDLNPTRDEALGALAQGDTHFQRQDITSFPSHEIWQHPSVTNDVLKEAMTRPNGVPFVSKLHLLVADMPPKVGVNELLGKIKSAGIKSEEIKWSRFDEFLASATAKGQKSITREEALGWLDKNYLQLEENRRFEQGSGSGRSDPNSNETIFGQYTIPGGQDANYNEFTIRLPSDEYGHLYQYTGHYPDANIIAHARTTDRTVAGDKTLMIEEIQSDWHQAGQKQGYKTPVTEHPGYADVMNGIQQNEKDAEAIAARIRRTITDSMFNHPTLPEFPEALRPAFERGGETSIGLNLTDQRAVDDWLAQIQAADDALHANPEDRARVVEVAGRNSRRDTKGYIVEIGDRRLDGPFYEYASDEGLAERNANKVAQNINTVLDMRPADRTSLINSVEAYADAHRQLQRWRNNLMQLERESATGVAKGPFQKTWHELAFKRMLSHAVENGYDRIAWTTGRTQAERYQLANFFKRIEIKQGSHYSGDYSDALYQWADAMAQDDVAYMSEEELGLTERQDEYLREEAASNFGYPNEEDFYIDPNTEARVPYDTEGAILDEYAYDEAMEEYLDNVDTRYEELKNEWLQEARDNHVESQREYYMTYPEEYDSAPKEGDLIVQAQDHNGAWHEYNASTDSSQENALENVVGPDIATRYHENGETEFEGDNLVAGENAKSALGASHFYDNKLTGFVNKYLKKTGVQSTMEEIGGKASPLGYRIDYKSYGGERGHWILNGRGDYPFSNFFDALTAQHREFHDIPKPTLTHGTMVEMLGPGHYADPEAATKQYTWVKWSDFPEGIKFTPNELWGPYDNADVAASEVEDRLINYERKWESVPGQGTVVHSIPVTDEVRKFVDQGLVLFQNDPLVKEIARTRMKGAVQLGGDKAKLHLFAYADVSTVVHELGHVVQQAVPSMAHLDPEEFARSFERYFMTAKAPTENLRLPFAEIDAGMRRVYGSPLKVPGAKLTPKMKAELDAFFKGAEKSHPDLYRALQGVHFQAEGGDDPAMLDAGQVQAQMLVAKGVHPDEAVRLTAQMFSLNEDALRAKMADTKGFERIHSNAQLDARYGAAETTGTAEDYLKSAEEKLRRDTKFQEDVPEPEISQDDSLARTFEPATDKTPEEALRAGMRGVPLRRSLQEQARSEERARRAKAYEAALSSGEGLEGHKAALHELKGELPKIDYEGFTELTPEALDHLVNKVRDHPHLLPYQKLRLIEALDHATRGELPTPSEQALIEHVFGKDTMNGLKEIAGLPAHIQNLIAEVLNVPRSVMASFDLSAPFRQGLVIGTRHPGIFFSNFPAMIKAFGSERVYKEIMAEVKSRPTFPMMHEARLAITDMENLDAREEQFYSNLAERLTGFPRRNAAGKIHLDPATSPIRMSGRAYSAFLVKTRADVFDHLIRVAEKTGKDVQDEKFLKDLGRYINAATGRGDLHMLQGAAPLLNTVFFSPRLLASRLNLLFAPLTYARADPFVRRQALISMLHLAGAAGALLTLASFVPGVTVQLDPRNADFGKIRVGNTRLDILGGFQQPVRLLSQMLTKTVISSTTGDPLTLGPQGPGKLSERDILQRFFEGKLAPVPSFVNDLLKGTDFMGQPFSWKKELYSHMVPLLAQDTASLYQEGEKHGTNGLALALGGYGIGAFGVGIQTYGPKNPATKPTTKLQQEAKKAGMPGPTKDILIDVEHKANLDALSQKHQGDPEGKLDAYIKYYAETTGDHQYDRWIGAKLSDDAAQLGADNIRHALVGAGLSQYEAAIRASLKAQGKKWSDK